MKKIVLALLLFAVAPVVSAQTADIPPFFSDVATPYDAQVAASFSGSILRSPMASARPAISPALSSPLGIAVAGIGPAPGEGVAVTAAPAPIPSILDKPGMTFISPPGP